ncbi:MAG: hypothetical protein ABIN48_04115 [Ginsengibacter sp.]
MKFKIVIFFLLLASGTQLKAQYYFYNGDYYEADIVYEFGGSIGAMNAMTDLGGRKGVGKRGMKDFNLKNTELSGGAFFGVMFKNAIGVRLEATFGKVKGYDSDLKNVAASTSGRYERNLSFESSISELVGVVELHPFEMFGNYNDDKYPPVVSPYLVGGVGVFKFNPRTLLNGQWINLQPLRTEGQGFPEYPHVKEYKLTQINFPIGMGARYDITPIINVRAEFLYRFLMTDYLDDVSGKYIEPSVFANHLSGIQLTHAILLNDRHIPGAAYSTAHPDGIRGNPNNDAYLTFSIKLGITLGRERR